MSEEVRLGIYIDVQGFITRACQSCGGVTDPNSDSPDRCECGTEPDRELVTIRTPWPWPSDAAKNYTERKGT